MAIKQYLDKTGLQNLWSKICWQDQDLLEKIEANTGRINEIVEDQVEIQYDTSAHWEEKSSLVSHTGVIYVYTDARTVLGNSAARVKIGDGVTLLTNLPFIDEDVVDAIDNLVPITVEDVANWNDKVGCRIVNTTTLQFYNDEDEEN